MPFFLSSDIGKRSIDYSLGKGQACVSVVTAMLSIALALLILKDYDLILLLIYFIVTFLIGTTVFALKFLLLSYRNVNSLENSPVNNERGYQEKILKRNLLILVIVYIASLFSPLILSLFLDPSMWFISISGFISGIGIEEGIFYFYARKD